MRIPDHFTWPLRNLYAGQEATVGTRHGKIDWFKIGKGVCQGVPCQLVELICRVHHMKCLAGWITSWNQDFWKKYQQPQICSWYHANGRKWRATKEPLDDGERGEWKSWLKTQHSKNLRSWHPVSFSSVQFSHSVASEQASFMTAITICSDFGAQEKKVSHCFHCFPIYLPWSDGTRCHDLKFFECWVSSQLFHSPLSLSLRRGFRMGNTCTPMADSCQCMAKTTTIL